MSEKHNRRKDDYELGTGMSMEKEYLQDKKYIHSTLEHTKEHTEKLYDKLNDFKLDVTQSLAEIKTKLTIYIAIASVSVGVIVQVVFHFTGKN